MTRAPGWELPATPRTNLPPLPTITVGTTTEEGVVKKILKKARK